MEEGTLAAAAAAGNAMGWLPTAKPAELAGRYESGDGLKLELRPDGTADVSYAVREPPEDDAYSLAGVTWSLNHDDGQTTVRFLFEYYMDPMERRYRTYMPAEATSHCSLPVLRYPDGEVKMLHVVHGWFIRQPAEALDAIVPQGIGRNQAEQYAAPVVPPLPTSEPPGLPTVPALPAHGLAFDLSGLVPQRQTDTA